MKTRALLLSAILLAVPPAKASDLEFAAEANVLCRAIIDERDYATFKAAQDKSLDLTLAHLRSETPPSTEDAQTLSQLLQAVNADLIAAIKRLKGLKSSPKLASFLAYGQSRVDINAARVGFLADLATWRWPPADSLDTSEYDFNVGVADLGFTDRDCTYVFGSLGNSPELSEFITAVAAVCNMTYDRLIETDVGQWREHNLNAMIAALQGGAQDPSAIPALRNLATAWKEAARDFREVNINNEEKSHLWDEAIAIMYKRAGILEERASAIEHRDEEAIRDAFAKRVATPDFEQLGLRETSCMALVSLM